MSTMPKLPVAEVDCACFHDIRSLTLIGITENARVFKISGSEQAGLLLDGMGSKRNDRGTQL